MDAMAPNTVDRRRGGASTWVGPERRRATNAPPWSARDQPWAGPASAPVAATSPDVRRAGGAATSRGGLTTPARRPAKLTPADGVVAVVVYEVLAHEVNDYVGEELLPSLTAAIQHFSWRAFRRRVVPTWAPPVGFMVIGLVISAVRAVRRGWAPG